MGAWGLPVVFILTLDAQTWDGSTVQQCRRGSDQLSLCGRPPIPVIEDVWCGVRRDYIGQLLQPVNISTIFHPCPLNDPAEIPSGRRDAAPKEAGKLCQGLIFAASRA